MYSSFTRRVTCRFSVLIMEESTRDTPLKLAHTNFKGERFVVSDRDNESR